MPRDREGDGFHKAGAVVSNLWVQRPPEWLKGILRLTPIFPNANEVGWGQEAAF